MGREIGLRQARKMNQRYRDKSEKLLGARRSIYEIGLDYLRESYGTKARDWGECIGLCKSFTQAMMVHKKTGELNNGWEMIRFTTGRNGISRDGYYLGPPYIGSPLERKSNNAKIMKIYLEGDVLRVVGPPNLSQDDISDITSGSIGSKKIKIDTKYISRIA
jgi:hypothetical protein